MNEETQKKAMEMLEALAEKLGTTLEHLWEVLIRQALVEGAYALVLAVFGMAALGGLIYACVLGVRAGRRLAEKEDDTFYLHGSQAVGGVLLLLFGAMVLDIFVLRNIHTALICFINPEYWAIREVLRLL